LNSYAYYIQDEWKSPADSRADFLKTLSREKFEANLSMQKGLDFEYLVEKTCDWQNTDWVNLLQMKCQKLKSLQISTHGDAVKFLQDNSDYVKCIESIGEIVKGSIWQQSVKKEITVGNQEFLLYGRTDVIKRDTVYDIKFTSNYELGKFLDSSQHLIYLFCSDLPNFSYLISDGKEFWREDYHNHAGIENEIKSKISDFLGYLENDKEAKEIFLTKWESKNNNNS
jgi:hypothetical protein